MVVVAATQMSCSENREGNVDKAEAMVRKAAAEGAQIILLQELFESVYFPQTEDKEYFSYARAFDNNPVIKRMSALAKELSVVLPVSFFEYCRPVFFNTTAVIDADGSTLGIYRKTHIPDDPGYYEKYYFAPGDTGFRVWKTKYGTIGIGICWDQWFPEAARIMALQGAELLLYPTAIGSPAIAENDKCDDMVHDMDYVRWQNVMLGHAAANMIPVIASNRTGIEHCKSAGTYIKFWGSSFLSDNTGRILEEADMDSETILLREYDLDKLRERRKNSYFFRDRRTDCYAPLLNLYAD